MDRRRPIGHGLICRLAEPSHYPHPHRHVTQTWVYQIDYEKRITFTRNVRAVLGLGRILRLIRVEMNEISSDSFDTDIVLHAHITVRAYYVWQEYRKNRQRTDDLMERDRTFESGRTEPQHRPAYHPCDGAQRDYRKEHRRHMIFHPLSSHPLLKNHISFSARNMKTTLENYEVFFMIRPRARILSFFSRFRTRRTEKRGINSY